MGAEVQTIFTVDLSQYVDGLKTMLAMTSDAGAQLKDLLNFDIQTPDYSKLDAQLAGLTQRTQDYTAAQAEVAQTVATESTPAVEANTVATDQNSNVVAKSKSLYQQMRGEVRQQSFYMRESRELINALSFGFLALMGSQDDASESTKRLNKSLMDGFAAFQGLNFLMMAIGAGEWALPVAAIAGIAVVIAKLAGSSGDAKKNMEELQAIVEEYNKGLGYQDLINERAKEQASLQGIIKEQEQLNAKYKTAIATAVQEGGQTDKNTLAIIKNHDTQAAQLQTAITKRQQLIQTYTSEINAMKDAQDVETRKAHNSDTTAAKQKKDAEGYAKLLKQLEDEDLKRVEQQDLQKVQSLTKFSLATVKMYQQIAAAHKKDAAQEEKENKKTFDERLSELQKEYYYISGPLHSGWETLNSEILHGNVKIKDIWKEIGKEALNTILEIFEKQIEYEALLLIKGETGAAASTATTSAAMATIAAAAAQAAALVSIATFGAAEIAADSALPTTIAMFQAAAKIPSFANGTPLGGFNVPSGFNNDNFLIGVSSGENVRVSPNAKNIKDSSGNQSISITVNVPNFVGDQKHFEQTIKPAVQAAMKSLGASSVTELFINKAKRVS